MSDPNVPINPPGGPYFTQRLWSEEVAIARAEAGDLGSNRILVMSSAMDADSSSH